MARRLVFGKSDIQTEYTNKATSLTESVDGLSDMLNISSDDLEAEAHTRQISESISDELIDAMKVSVNSMMLTEKYIGEQYDKMVYF